MASEVPNASKSKLKADKIFWTDGMDSIMLDVFLEHLNLGRRSQNGWKKDVTYVAIVDAIYDKLEKKLTITHIENRVKTMRNRISSYKQCKISHSGFGYDPETGRLVADQLVWDAIIKENPKASTYKDKIWPRLMEWMEVLGENVALGNIQRTAATREEDILADNGDLQYGVDPLVGNDAHLDDSSYIYDIGSQYATTHQGPNSYAIPNTEPPSKLHPRKRKSVEPKPPGVKEEMEGIKTAVLDVAGAMKEKVRHDDALWDKVDAAINSIEELTDEEKVDALDLFSGDHDKKRCFLKIPTHMRSRWIRKKLNPNNEDLC